MPDQPDLQWFAPDQNPWRVRLLDVRPVTFTMLSTSSDPQCAANAISFAGDNGSSFAAAEPPLVRSVAASLRYRRAPVLTDGALFRPSTMEQKWALFFLQKRIVCVRSWQRKVLAVADTEDHGEFLEVTGICGAFADEDEPQDFTVRCLDFLLRSHALGVEYPAPLLPGAEQDPWKAALWCFSCFGDKASCATPDKLVGDVPAEPLKNV